MDFHTQIRFIIDIMMSCVADNDITMIFLDRFFAGLTVRHHVRWSVPLLYSRGGRFLIKRHCLLLVPGFRSGRENDPAYGRS